MRNEKWSVADGKLVVNYTTTSGKEKCQEFDFAGKTAGGGLNFMKKGTRSALKNITFDNLTQCYTPLYNTTPFSAFIRCDLSDFF